MTSGLVQDFRLSIRSLLGADSSAVAVLTLAIAIGANAAVFSVVNSLLIRSLPVAAPDRLMWISSDFAADRGFKSGVGWNYEMWEAFRPRAAFVAGALAWQGQRFTLGDRAGASTANGIYASGGFFTTLGVGAARGRVLTEDDDRPGQPPVALISYALWQRRFASAPDIIGTSMLVNQTPVTIVGVTAASFRGLEVGTAFDLALPLSAEPAIAGPSSALYKSRSYMLLVMLRLKDGQRASEATQTLRSLQSQIVPPNAPTFVSEPFTLTPAAGGASTPASSQQIYRRPLVIMLAGIGLVLVIACVNIANLVFARASQRRRELSMRMALGASRWRLARPLLVESLLLATAGAALGVIWAHWGARAIVGLSPVALEPVADWRLVGFVLAISFAAVIFCGLAPARRATRIAPADGLRAGRGAAETTGGRLLDGLVIVQVSLALVVVLAGALLTSTLARLSKQPLGFDHDRVLVINVDTGRSAGHAAERPALHHRLVAATAAVPGVERSAASIWTPLAGGGATTGLRPAASPSDAAPVTVLKNMVSPGWLAVYGTPLRAGRDFNDGDAASGPAVAIVNEAFARRFFAGDNAVGLTTPDKRLVVGVAADAVFRSSQRIPGAASLALREAVPPTIYVPLAQFPLEERLGADTIRISVRSAAGPPSALAPSLAAALTAVDPNVTVQFRPLDDYVREALAQERMTATLGIAFGVIALLLAALGLYGITFHAAMRRRTEMGVRMALGATRGDVIRAMLRPALVLIAAGLAFGLIAAILAMRWLESLLFGVTAMDPATFAGVTALLAATGATAAFIPAHRASRLDPSTALRAE